MKEVPGGPPLILITSLGKLLVRCLLRRNSYFSIPVLSMVTFGSIPALLSAKRERLFNVIFCPLRTIISIGIDSGEIVPFLRPTNKFLFEGF